MACRIMRGFTILHYVSIPENCRFHSFNIKTKLNDIRILIPIRNYNNYKTSGEMLALKEPPNGLRFNEEPEYPEIVDVTREGLARRGRQTNYDEIKSMPTAYHKMFLLNAERGREEILYIGDLHYNSLDLYSYATRTLHNIEESAMTTASVPIDSSLVTLVEMVIAAHFSNPKNDCLSEEAKEKTSGKLVQGIIDAVRYYYKLSELTMLEQARIEAFWQHSRFRTNFDKERFGEKIHFPPWFQFKQDAQVLVSSEVPLKPIINFDSPAVFGCDFPQFDYFPEEFGMFRKKHRLVSTPGYWCDALQYPVLTTSALKKVLPSSLDPSVNTDHLNQFERRRRLAAHGLMFNFATAAAAAFNCGFTNFHEITYPFVTQHVVSDGQIWHFSKYQLNTLAFGPDFHQNKQNFAWSSEEMKLYGAVENGKVHDLNTSVLSRLVATIRAPVEMVENPRPYVDLNVDKDFLERGANLFKKIACRRFNLHEHMHFEIPLWVKIYKINKDAPPSPMLNWERQKYHHIYQFNNELYNAEMEKTKEVMKRIARSNLFGKPLKKRLSKRL